MEQGLEVVTVDQLLEGELDNHLVDMMELDCCSRNMSKYMLGKPIYHVMVL